MDDKARKKAEKARLKAQKKREQIQKKITQVIGKLNVFSLKTDEFRTIFLENDGVIDEKEQKKLDKIDKGIAKLLKKIDQIRAKMPAKAPEAKQHPEYIAFTQDLAQLEAELTTMVAMYGIDSNQNPYS